MQRTYLEATKLEVIRPHDNAVEAPCPYVGACGGCSLQTLDYASQLTLKRSRLLLQLHNAFGFADAEGIVKDVIGCEEPFGCDSWRNVKLNVKMLQPSSLHHMQFPTKQNVKSTRKASKPLTYNHVA